MHVVAHATLVTFYSQTQYRGARGALQAWYEVACQARWRSPADVKAQFGTASIVGNNRVVFNIKGNDYRLIVAFAYRMQWAFIKFVGTHGRNLAHQRPCTHAGLCCPGRPKPCGPRPH